MPCVYISPDQQLSVSVLLFLIVLSGLLLTTLFPTSWLVFGQLALHLYLNLESDDDNGSEMDNTPGATHHTALSQGFGYGIVLGLGFAFALGMIGTTWALKRYSRAVLLGIQAADKEHPANGARRCCRYQNEVQTSEMFSTAGRTVKTGLVASAVVSSWTWAATLLQSSGVAYRYGVSGPFWYASGATVQILLFATLAIELKRKAPNAHTFLEVIKARYGAYAHITFMVFGLCTNIL